MQQEQSNNNDDDKIQQILLKSQILLDNGQYYEYEQKILTFGCRFINQKKIDLAIQLYLQASKILLKQNQSNSGFNLAYKILEHLEQIDQKILCDLLSLYSVAQFSKQKIQFINRVLLKYPQFKEQICATVGVDLINQQKYHLAWRYLVQTKEIATEISLLEKWNTQLSEQEKEYNIVRYILMYQNQLSLVNQVKDYIKESKQIINHLLPTKITIPSLFIHLLLQTILLQSKQAYDQLFNQFKQFLQIDVTFQDVLQNVINQLYYKVGIRYFGLKEQAQQSGLGILGQFFQ